MVQSAEQIVKECIDVLNKKGQDYNHGNADPLSAFKYAASIVDIPISSVILTRISDKLSRIASLTRSGSNVGAAHENILDTSLDIINYAILLRIAIQEQLEQESPAAPSIINHS